MLWYVFQGLIIFAFVGSNDAYNWTPNHYIPVIFGVGSAFLVTTLVSRLLYGERLYRGPSKQELSPPR